MPKTIFDPYGTVLTSEFAQSIYGQDEQGGHLHDGLDEDGHCPKITKEQVDESFYLTLVKEAIEEVRFNYMPIGTIHMYGAVTPPDGYLRCDGSPVPQHAQYDKFRAWIDANAPYLHVDYVYKTPDMRGRVPVCYGATTGTPTPDGTPHIYYEMGQTGGQTQATLDVKNLPPHTHRYESTTHDSDSGRITSGNSSSDNNNTPRWIDGLGDSSFNGERSYGIKGINYDGTLWSQKSMWAQYPHDNMQPYISVNFIIRAE